LTAFPVLAVIPDIVSDEEKQSVMARRRTRIIVAIGAVIAFLLIFHFFIMDFDVLWAKLVRRLAL
jgi:hypothetical protein